MLLAPIKRSRELMFLGLVRRQIVLTAMLTAPSVVRFTTIPGVKPKQNLSGLAQSVIRRRPPERRVDKILTAHRPEPAQPHQLCTARASLRSIFTRIADSAAVTCRFSRSSSGSPLSRNALQPLRQRACLQFDPLQPHTAI